MVEKCKFYHTNKPAGFGCDWCGCNKATTCPFPKGIGSLMWTVAEEICKFYEPEEKWAIFAVSSMGVKIQISEPFSSEEEARAAICSYMKNVEVRKDN